MRDPRQNLGACAAREYEGKFVDEDDDRDTWSDRDPEDEDWDDWGEDDPEDAEWGDWDDDEQGPSVPAPGSTPHRI